MELGELLSFITTNGFAVVLCLYMVINVNKTIEKNTQALQDLAHYIKGADSNE